MMRIYNDEFSNQFPTAPAGFAHRGHSYFEQCIKGGNNEGLQDCLSKDPGIANRRIESGRGNIIFPLGVACLAQNVKAAEILLRNGAQINARSSGVSCTGKYFSLTPLHMATVLNCLEMVKFLVKKGADVDARMEPNGYTALHLAVTYGHEKIGCFLVHECDADPNIPSREDYCNYPILKALFKRDCRMLLLLLSSSRINPNVADGNDRSSAMHYAVAQNCIEAITLLLNQNADPNPKLTSGHTPLDLAYAAEMESNVREILEARGGKRNEKRAYVPFIYVLRDAHISKLKFAVQTGANVNCKLFDGLRLLQHVIEVRQAKVIRLLITSGADIKCADHFGTTALHTAAFFGDVETIHLLLKRGADVNAVDGLGRTPLHRAAESGASDACRVLIQKGAQIGVYAKEFGSPLFLATIRGCYESVKVLLEAGEDPNGKITYLEIHGITPLHLACAESKLEIVKLLLKQGADPNAPALADRVLYPLDNVDFAHSKAVDVVTKLIDSGAFIDVDSDRRMRLKCPESEQAVPTLEQRIIEKSNFIVYEVYKSTLALFNAVKRNNLDEVRECVRDGGLINCCSVTYDTPLIYASYLGSLPLVDYLLKNGAVMYMPNVTRSSPLHYAAKYDRRDVAVRLLKAGARVSFLCQGKTAIEVALARGHREMVNILVFVGRYLLEIGRKTISPVNYKKDPVVVKVLNEMGGKRPPKKVIAALFSE